MIDWIIPILRSKPELVIFLTLAKFNEGDTVSSGPPSEACSTRTTRSPRSSLSGGSEWNSCILLYWPLQFEGQRMCGLVYTVAGFFAPLAVSIDMFGAKLANHAAEVSILQRATVVAGGAAWFLATYAGPVVSLVRSPFGRRTNIAPRHRLCGSVADALLGQFSCRAAGTSRLWG